MAFIDDLKKEQRTKEEAQLQQRSKILKDKIEDIKRDCLKAAQNGEFHATIRMSDNRIYGGYTYEEAKYYADNLKYELRKPEYGFKQVIINMFENSDGYYLYGQVTWGDYPEPPKGCIRSIISFIFQSILGFVFVFHIFQ